MHAFKLYTGPDNASHLVEGELTLDRRTDVVAVHFENRRRIPRSTGTTRRSRNTSSRWRGRSNSPPATARPSSCARRRPGGDRRVGTGTNGGWSTTSRGVAAMSCSRGRADLFVPKR
jgi:hypothetical protein